MTRKNPRENRRRRTKLSIQKYGRNQRQVWNEYPAVKARLVYLCNLLFGGDDHEFAAAIGVCYRHFSRIVFGHSRLSVAMAAQIVTRINVRAEWLLAGVGAVFHRANEAHDSLILPLHLQSSFHLFDVAANSAGVEFFPAERVSFVETPVRDIRPYEEAGKAVYSARSNRKPVGFFLGSESCAIPLAQFAWPFFTARYADFLVMTLTAAAHDVREAHIGTPTDINSVARFAANRGIGYGEAFGFVGFAGDANREKSLLALVHDAGSPVFISAEIGEIGRHTATASRGAELGAAVGAAAYVDLLAYTEHLRHFFGQPGGVMIVAGECQRAVRMFLERLATLKLVEPEQTGFTFVLFSHQDDHLQTEIKTHGGNVIFLDPPTITTTSQLLQTCNDVYAGKITHERKHHKTI